MDVSVFFFEIRRVEQICYMVECVVRLFLTIALHLYATPGRRRENEGSRGSWSGRGARVRQGGGAHIMIGPEH